MNTVTLAPEWEDLVSEKEVCQKFNVTSETLRKMRCEGKIKNFSSLNGRRIMYSKKELMEILSR